MRFLLLLLLLPITYSLTINATGYTPNGVSYLVRQEISAMNDIVDDCVTSAIGKFPFDLGNMHRSEAAQMTHSAARCLFFQHHMRTSIHNQYTMIELIKKLQELFMEDVSLHTDMNIEVRNTTHVYMNILRDIQQEILTFQKQIHGYILNTAGNEESQVKDFIRYLDNEQKEIDEAKDGIGLDFSKLVDLYNYFVEKFLQIHKRLKMVDLYQSSNSTALNDAITLFKADIIAHYLQVADILDEQVLINSAFDAYECIGDDRTGCVFPNAVSHHFETCSRPSVLFGENGQFLSFNSLIQVAEESMCSPNTTCIDTQDTDWSELVQSWTNNVQSVSTDRWICVDFDAVASNVQGTRNHLRADKHTYAKQIAGWLQQQIDTDGDFNIASSGLTDAFNSFSITVLPAYDATKKIMSDDFVDDSSNTQCSINCRQNVLDTCCIDPTALKTMFKKNNNKYKVKYSTRVKAHNPGKYDRDEITITTEIAEPAVRYGYLQTSESSTLVFILKELNVTGCETVAECKKKASDAIDCTYNVNTRNENSDCDIGSLFLPDDRTTETVYTSSDLGTSSPIAINAYTPNTTTCNVEQDTTKNTIDECKTHLIQQLYRNSGPYTRNDFIFGHFSGTSCKLYKCTKTTFLENKAEGEGQDGQLIPLKPVQNKTVIIEVLQAGNSNVNPLALACPVNYEATCTACQGGWSIGNAARDAWTDIDASRQNPANPQNWGHCSESSERTRISTDTQSYCDATQTKPCQLVHVESATFDKTTGQLTVQWTNKASPLRDSINFLTIKHGNAYETIIDGSSEKVINSATPPDIHLYRSDTSGNDLGDKTVRVCAQHVANYNAYPVTVSPGCTTTTSKERQLKPITSECVVDETSSYGACQDRGDNDKQYKNLLQIKLPYDGSDPYADCTGASQSCYKCPFGQQNKNNDITQTCEDCTEGTYSNTYDELNKLTCQPCDGVSYYQNQTGQTSCKVVDTCAAGYRETREPSSTQNRLCEACPAGSVSSGTNQASCTACDGVSYYQDQPGQNYCKTVSSCPAGQGVNTTSTPDADTQCVDCVSGSTYSDVDSKTASCQVVNVCEPGIEAVLREPTASLDRLCQCAAGHFDNQGTCTECPSGRYQPSANQATTCPNTWSDCAAGTYISANGTTTSDRTCTPCASGSFTSTINQNTCTTWAVCGSNQYVSVQGSSTSDQTCADKKEDGSSCTVGQNQECTSNVCSDGLCVTPCTQDSQCTHLTDNYCNTEYGICLSKGEIDDPCDVSNVATNGACLSGFCDDGDDGSKTCQVACSPNNCHLCITEAECNTADHYTFCAWEYYNQTQCGTCPAGGVDNCTDTQTYFCTPCGESIAKQSDGGTCSEDRECLEPGSPCGPHNVCGNTCDEYSDCNTTSEFCDRNDDDYPNFGFCNPKQVHGEICNATNECAGDLFCDYGYCDTCDDAGYGGWTADGSCVNNLQTLTRTAADAKCTETSMSVECGICPEGTDAECPSGQTCYGNQCVTNCNNNGDCDTSEFCNIEGHCQDKVGQDESCGITDECLDNLFCNQLLPNPACNTCDDAGYGPWTADGSCVSGGWQVDASVKTYGSTSSTKYLTEADAQNACTNGCQGITRWAVDTGSNGCGSDYARFDSSSMCYSVGALIYGSTSNGNGCYTGNMAWANEADCVSESQMTCAYKNEHGYYNREYGKQCTSSRSCVCQYWTIGGLNDDGSSSDIPDTAISSKTLQNDQPLIRTTEDTGVCTDTSKTISCGTCPEGTECPSGQTCNTGSNTCEASGGGGGGDPADDGGYDGYGGYRR